MANHKSTTKLFNFDIHNKVCTVTVGKWYEIEQAYLSRERYGCKN